MEKMLRWFTQGVHNLYGGSRTQPDPRPTFEQVDSTRLGVSGFRASASMGLDTLDGPDFAETLPAYALSQPRSGGRQAGRRSFA
jgi:hypothetical protein